MDIGGSHALPGRIEFRRVTLAAWSTNGVSELAAGPLASRTTLQRLYLESIRNSRVITSLQLGSFYNPESMYSLGQIRRGVRRGISDPSIFAREINRHYYRWLTHRDYNPNGVNVVDEDWDTLLILDACRYDMFESQHNLPGRLVKRESRGSHTTEFLVANFGNERLHDIVYVTASPQLHRWRDRIDAEFHAVVNVWREEGWSDKHGTVRPETMAEHVHEATEQYPNKRIIGHFLQPHYPFIGAGENLNPRTFGNEEETGRDIWNELRTGNTAVSAATVWDAYRRNLDIVLPVVRDLLSELSGRTVVTSDHGNMIGERSSPLPITEWGHPPGTYTAELVSVPWLVYENGPRKEIVAETPTEASDDTDDDVVTERLQQLGYVS
ncbi:hypothetical protein [Natrinema sp. HArc-T2]|uniref:hypothetical protein n=1 Tax=Natrinema sp. HArc-T2 TaxID=3242701 RepID=UPI00359D0B11